MKNTRVMPLILKKIRILPVLFALTAALLFPAVVSAENEGGQRDLTLIEENPSGSMETVQSGEPAGRDPGTYGTAANGYAYTAPTVADNSLRVYDFANLLSDSEEAEITERIRKVEKAKKCTIIAVTTENVATDPNYGTDKTRAYAEDFYDANASGFEDDAFVLCVDMNNRVIYSVGHGKYAGEKYVSFEKKVYDDVYEKAREGNYPGVVRTFVEDVYRLENWRYALIPTAASVLISLAAGLIAAFVMIATHKHAEPAAHNIPAVEILDAKILRHDVYETGKHVTSHRYVRESSSSSGGGGSFSGGTHTSGGGGHFSGGGGHF